MITNTWYQDLLYTTRHSSAKMKKTSEEKNFKEKFLMLIIQNWKRAYILKNMLKHVHIIKRDIFLHHCIFQIKFRNKKESISMNQCEQAVPNTWIITEFHKKVGVSTDQSMQFLLIFGRWIRSRKCEVSSYFHINLEIRWTLKPIFTYIFCCSHENELFSEFWLDSDSVTRNAWKLTRLVCRNHFSCFFVLLWQIRKKCFLSPANFEAWRKESRNFAIPTSDSN